jgi:transposase
VPAEILHDRMCTAVTSEDMQGVAYNPTLLECARHYGFLPRACRAYRLKRKVKGPFRYVREDYFLARSFRNLDHLNAQLRQWLDGVANARVRATTRRVLAGTTRRSGPALSRCHPPLPSHAAPQAADHP